MRTREASSWPCPTIRHSAGAGDTASRSRAGVEPLEDGALGTRAVIEATERGLGHDPLPRAPSRALHLVGEAGGEAGDRVGPLHQDGVLVDVAVRLLALDRHHVAGPDVVGVLGEVREEPRALAEGNALGAHVAAEVEELRGRLCERAERDDAPPVLDAGVVEVEAAVDAAEPATLRRVPRARRTLEAVEDEVDADLRRPGFARGVEGRVALALELEALAAMKVRAHPYRPQDAVAIRVLLALGPVEAERLGQLLAMHDVVRSEEHTSELQSLA